MTTKRARNIDNKIIEEIVGILDGWSGKLTWDLLIEAVAKRFRHTYSRQALFQHERILSAFQQRKDVLAEARSKTPKPANLHSAEEVEMLVARNERLVAENDRLKTENNRLLEQFALWAYNAHTRGLSEAFLSQPLPRVDREPTRLKAVSTAPKKGRTDRKVT